MAREFTGRHMLLTFVGGFGVVVAVNFYMASQAASSFGGVTVENSYIASQKFNGWLDEARAQEALGWGAELVRKDDGYLVVEAVGVPAGAEISAELRHPLGLKDRARLTFAPQAAMRYISNEKVESGRWTVRLTILSGKDRWEREMPLE
ncbi:MAG: hypothetical protein EP350_02725 [Alphaproteobacteria bacterium]|nr:MAG: hypothetical protein EP350_02725 [Alphaproteobacteria bacterium]